MGGHERRTPRVPLEFCSYRSEDLGGDEVVELEIKQFLRICWSRDDAGKCLFEYFKSHVSYVTVKTRQCEILKEVNDRPDFLRVYSNPERKTHF